MTLRKRTTFVLVALGALAAGALAGCAEHNSQRQPEGGAARSEAVHAEPGRSEPAGAQHATIEDAHTGHTHAAETEVSDLDRSVEELFAASCEHGVRTHACSECRYEVGVVEAPGGLFEGGLLQVATVGERRLETPLQLTGEVQFDERRVTHVGSQVEGILRKVHVSLGDRVREGQPLAEIDVVELGEAQAASLEAQGLLRLARRNLERVAELHASGIVSEKEHFQAQQDLEAAEIRAEGALGKLTRLGMQPDEARALTQATSTGRLVLQAPASGSVLQMHAVPGELAKKEESLFTVGDHRAVWVWADLYERDVARVVRAQAQSPLAVRVSVQAYPEEEFPGAVDFVSPAVSPVSRTVKLRIALANADGRLLAGMFARVELYLPGQEQVRAVPDAAVLEDEGRRFVFVHHTGDYWVRRPVTTGRVFAGWTELVEGPAAGARIVADGAFLLKSDVLRSKMGAGCAD